MAFTLKIKSKGIFNRVKKLDLERLIKNCGMNYGSCNEFYVLQENKIVDGTVILYNPNRIGRGIFLDMEGISKGEITISYNIPTTSAEIRDFVRIVKEIDRQFVKSTFYCEEEKIDYTIETLEANIDRMIAFSVDKLHEFCNNNELHTLILSMAKFPWYLPNEKRECYKTCITLEDFEQTMHDLQNVDVYYAKPSLMKNNIDGKITAFYTLTEECDSIFPISPRSFINLDNIKIDDSKIRFYIYSENKVVDGFYSYEKFVDFMMKNYGKQFDAEHFLISPGIRKEDIDTIIKSIDEELI